jgi:hypothetical protein
MNRFEKALAILLRASAVLLLVALIPAVMPFAWMDKIHHNLGLGSLPDMPIMGYLTRSVSALYALHGGLILFLSMDVRRFLPVIECLAVLGIVFGIGMLVLDWAVGLPPAWILGEGPFVAALAGVLLWLTRRIKANAAAHQE